MPSLLLRAVYLTWVATFVAATSTFGTGLPSLLWTVPVKLANCVCASSGAAASSASDNAPRTFNVNCLLILLLPSGFAPRRVMTPGNDHFVSIRSPFLDL